MRLSGGSRRSCRSRWTAPRTESLCAYGGRTAAFAWAAAAAGASLLGGPQAQAAAEAPIRAFHIPAEPLADALVDFGLQGAVSIGAANLSQCQALGHTVNGRMTVEEGLARLLGDGRCSYETVDARTYRIVRRVPPTVAPGPRVAPTPPVEAPTISNVLLDVTVTTTKRPTLIDRVPASVSTAGANLLTAGHIESLTDLSAEFAGVTATNLGPGRDKVFIRGLSDGAFTGRTQSTVGLYLDDVPITYNAPDPDLRLVDVDRVELMRGPQGSLYGVGSMGGIVRIVTKKPELDQFDAGIAASGEATHDGRPSTSLDAMVNIPVVQDKVAVRAVAYHEDSGGYIDDPALGLSDVNRTQRLGGRAAVAAELGGDWRLTTGLNYQELKSDDSQYADASLAPMTRNNLVREPHENDFAQGFTTLEGGGGWGRLKVSTAYLVHDFNSRYDASLVAPLFGGPPGPAAFDDDNRIRMAVAEAVVTSPPWRKLQWLIGAYGSDALQRSILALNALTPAALNQLYYEQRNDHLGEAALYGEFTYPLTRALSVTAGARIFHSWLSTTSLVTQGPANRPFSGYTETNDLSPKAVLSWQASPNTLFYTLASEGYRVGGFNTSGRIGQIFSASAVGRQPDRLFRPDTLWNFELGAKLSVLDDRLQLRSAVFYDDWRDIQSDQFQGSGLPYTANVGSGDNKGVEIEAEGRVNARFTVRLNMLANSPELTERDPTYPSRRNASLPAVPQYSASLIVDYRRQVSPKLSVVAHARAIYVGKSILTLEEQNNQPMGDYATGRLSAGIEATKGWRLTAFVDNPTNSRGDTFAFGDPFSLGLVRQVTPLRPRTFGLTLAWGL